MAEQFKCSESGFCPAMVRYLEPEPNGHTTGISTVQICNLRTGDFRVGGVVYKRTPRTGKQGVMLNYCPWCGERVLWLPERKNAPEVRP